MDKPKLNYRFHHEESPEKLAKAIIRICIEANMKRVENAIREELACALDKEESIREEKSERKEIHGG